MRYLYLETNRRFDLDEDGLPCIEPESSEVETPEDPIICPVLRGWILESKTVVEVSDAFKGHDVECAVCKPGMRRAA